MSKFESSFSRKPSPPRKEMELEVKVLTDLPTQADRIRYLINKFPDAKNGEIARFLEIRPQWVHNVRNYKPKRK